MKRFVCLFSFILITSFLLCQEDCVDIHKFNDNHYYLTQNNQEKNAYCIHCQVSILGINLTNNLYKFQISEDSSIIVHLSRKWNVIKPLWNTIFTSDTIMMLPVGDIMYVCNGDTILFEGYKSAYVGPKFSAIRRKKVH